MTQTRHRKSEVRKELLRKREAITTDEHRSASRACCEHFSTLFSNANTVALYAPIRNEIDLLGLLTTDSERRFVFPKVDNDDLVFAPGTRDTLRPGTFGVREPTCAPIALEEIDFMVVPGLGFDRRGMRLGYGGGFYDRTLRKLHGVPTYGAAFEIQITENLPVEQHDVSLSGWVTQTRIWTKEIQ